MCHQKHSCRCNENLHHKNVNKEFNCESHKNWRKFATKDEKKVELEKYKSELEAELKAVNELFTELDEK